jgi:lysyl-tRNA synthetase class 2
LPLTIRKKNLALRSRILYAIRHYFLAEGFMEVETPNRIPAPAPEAHIDAQPAGGWYLHTSPELCMKRLLAHGFEKIFQICKCYRQKERGGRHIPEMTMLEWYQAGLGYTEMMDQCEDLIRYTADEIGLGGEISYQSKTIDLASPWQRLTVSEAFRRYGKVSVEQALAEDRFDEVMGVEIEPRLGNEKPVFLCDYPVACGALARSKPSDPSVVERFELFIAGIELCNAFGELTDADQQRRRFEEEIHQRQASGRVVYPMPEKFLAELTQMPAASGNALGIDRLVMLFADATRIDDVVAFTPEEL